MEISSHSYSELLNLTHCGLEMPYGGLGIDLGQRWLLVNEVQGLVAFTWEQFHSKDPSNYFAYNEFETYAFEIVATSSRGQWVNSLWPSYAIWHQITLSA